MKRGIGLEHVVVGACVVAGAASVSGPVSDNSLLVHVTTGLGILDSGSIPRSDPYSFTALGESWTVQSWLASVFYGLAERAGGAQMVTALHMALAAAAVLAMGIVARSATMLGTLGVLIVPTVLAVLTWTQRPTLFGIAAFAAVVAIVHTKKSPWLLLPVMWLWVNTHGSFPIGLVWIAAVLAGSYLDQRRIDRGISRYLGVGVLGALLGAINPLGPKILLFASELAGDRAESFEAIVEWQSPDFHSITGAIALLSMMAIIAVGFAGRVRWTYAVGVIGLIAASLYSARYLALLPVAAVPLLKSLLEQMPMPATVSDEREARRDQVVAAVAMALISLVGVGFLARAFVQSPTDFEAYPVQAIDWMQNNGLLDENQRVAATDVTGCYLIWRYQGDVGVFIDDRVDMYPVEVSEAYRHLVNLDEPAGPTLDTYRIDHVVWPKDKPLANALVLDEGWTTVWESDDWLVSSRS